MLRAGARVRELWAAGAEAPLRFHGGLGVVRIRRLLSGDHDVMVSALDLRPGDRVLDATAGLCADALVAAHAVGDGGEVVACEASPLLAELLAFGAAHPPGDPPVAAACARLRIVAAEHLAFLRAQPDRSFDQVYFDPMFRRPTGAALDFARLRDLADPRPLERAALEEARRVARRRVVVRDRRESRELVRLGLVPIPGLSRTGATKYGMLP